MRALYLLGLADEDGHPLRYRPPAAAPLLLPGVLRPEDQFQVVNFYQQALADGPSRRSEIDWHTRMPKPAQRYLLEARQRWGSDGLMVVVRVHQALEDERTILEHPALRAFQHVVLVSMAGPMPWGLRGLSALSAFVRDELEQTYERLAPMLDLKLEAWGPVDALVSSLLGPVDIVEAVNGLIDVQIEGHARDAWEQAVALRVLRRQLEWRCPAEFIALLAIAVGQPEQVDSILGEEAEGARRSLTDQLLLRDGELTHWAKALTRRSLRDKLLEPGGGLPTDAQLTKQWAERVERVLALLEVGETRTVEPAAAEFRELVLGTFALVREGRLDRALEVLGGLSERLEEEGVDDIQRGYYWDVVGRLRLGMGRWELAREAFETSLRSKEEGGDTPISRGITLDVYARGLRDNGDWPRARELFEESLRSKEEGGAAPISRGITMHEYACGLRDNGDWPRARELFEQSLRLVEEGGATPISRGITMHEYARGLRDNGDWPRACELFEQSLRLKEEGGDTPISHWITMHEYACGLRDNGDWPRACELFEESLRLVEGGATPISRGITMDEYARGLRDNGDWPRARELFEESLRSKEEGGATLISRGITMDAYARGLRDHGEWEEARAAFEEALRLGDEGGDTPKDIAITLRAYAKGLADNGEKNEARKLRRRATMLERKAATQAE